MRLLYITDIHGYYEPMVRLLEYAKYSPLSDELVIGGDMINRGPDGGLVLKTLRGLQDLSPSNVHINKGNHEEMICDYRAGTSLAFLHFGGNETIRSLHEVYGKNSPMIDEMIDWLSCLPIITEHKDYIFSHAGISPFMPLHWQDPSIIWMNKSEFYGYDSHSLLELTNQRKIVHGHTPYPEVTDDGCRISCDLGSIKQNKKLGLVDLTNQIYYIYSFKSDKIFKKQIKKIDFMEDI